MTNPHSVLGGDPDPARRWNDLCQAWAARPNLPALPTGDRLELCRRLFEAEEREAKEEIVASLIVHGAPDEMDLAALFQRTDTGKFRWQVIIDQVNEDITQEMLRDAQNDMCEFQAWLRWLKR